MGRVSRFLNMNLPYNIVKKRWGKSNSVYKKRIGHSVSRNKSSTVMRSLLHAMPTYPDGVSTQMVGISVSNVRPCHRILADDTTTELHV